MYVECTTSRTRAQRRLRRCAALLVLLGCAIGWLMVVVPFRNLLAKFLLYQLHQTIGIVAFVLFMGVLLVRFRYGHPDQGDAIAPWQRQALTAVHASTFVLIAAIPVLGYLTAATAPGQIPIFFLGLIRIPNLVGENLGWFPILRQVHRGLANLLVLLGFAHAFAARLRLPRTQVRWRVSKTSRLCR